MFLAVQGVEYWLRSLNLRHMKRYGTAVPPGFEAYIDKETLANAVSYTLESSALSLKESILGIFVTVVFFFGGLLNFYNSWIDSLRLPFVLKGTLFFLLLSYASSFLSMPFSLYSTFKIEQKYGFNTMTPRLWAADFLKSQALSTVLVGIMLSIGLWIVQASPGHWWLFVWGFFFVVSIFLMYVSPYVIEPLFNKFTPLDLPGLEDRIRELMSAAGIRVSRVFKMDASKRSKHTNAYFSGIGKVKRIVLFDTLLGMMDDEEVLAVLAHEAGHWKKKHVMKMVALTEILALAGAFLAFRVLSAWNVSSLLQVRAPSFFSDVTVLAFLFSIAFSPLTPVLSFFSRRHEDEADDFASELTGRPESLATSLIKLSKDNLSNLHPHPLYAKIYYSHPPVAERVRRLRGEAA